MKLHLPRRFPVVAVAVVALLVVVTALYGAIRIGGSSFSVNNQVARDHQYTGACPVDLKFDRGVIDSHPGTISYTTIRNDGAQSGPRAVNHPGGNRSIPIMEHWRLGGRGPQFANYQGWMQINIESPSRASHRISFTLHCQ